MSNTPRTVGVGLISVGWMGKVHSRAYQALPVVYPELGIKPRLIIAADTAQDRADYAVNVLGYEQGTLDYHEVLNHPEVEVVSICAPNFLHAEIGIAAAKAGKAFWIEKPVGRGAAETEAVEAAANEAGVISTIGFNYRNAPAVEHAKKIIAEGQLVALDQHGIPARFGKVIGDAITDGTTADDQSFDMGFHEARLHREFCTLMRRNGGGVVRAGRHMSDKNDMRCEKRHRVRSSAKIFRRKILGGASAPLGLRPHPPRIFGQRGFRSPVRSSRGRGRIRQRLRRG